MNKQRGFSLVEGLLLLVVVSILGFAGYTVWNNNQDKTNNSLTAVSEAEETSKKVDNTAKKTDEADEIPKDFEKVTLTFDGFSVDIPKEWNYRECMGIQGLGSLVAGGGGPMACTSSDAPFLTTEDMAPKGKVAIGFGVNPFPRQSYQGETSTFTELYDKDAESVTLSNGKVVKKFVYTQLENKTNPFNIIEYTFEDKVTVYVFDGHSAESQFETNGLKTTAIDDLINQVVLTSVELN